MSTSITLTASASGSSPEPIEQRLRSAETGYAKAISFIGEYLKVLGEEKERWTKIHSNPVPDTVKVENTGDEVVVTFEIDSGVKNLINDKPIRRRYTLNKRRRLLGNADILLGASLALHDGWRPVVGMGLPIPFLARFGTVGIGAYTTVYSIGGTLYGELPWVPGLMLQYIVGVNWHGESVQGIGLGVTL